MTSSLYFCSFLFPTAPIRKVLNQAYVGKLQFDIYNQSVESEEHKQKSCHAASHLKESKKQCLKLSIVDISNIHYDWMYSRICRIRHLKGMRKK